jgi:hypothetical protein
MRHPDNPNNPRDNPADNPEVADGETWGLLALPFAALMASASGASGGRSKQASTTLYYF